MIDYKSAGVDIAKGDALVAEIKRMLGEAGSGIGLFGGAVPLPVGKYREPLLVTSIDGVGTKTKIALKMGVYDTIGQDLVHHCINDIACCGAEPLAFADYIAMDEMNVEIATGVVSGVVAACKRWEVSLAGGENAEMPGVYQLGELDLVGAIYGIVEKDKFIDGKTIGAGDVLIGFPANGLHTNGYSLARKIIEANNLNYSVIPGGMSTSIGKVLLEVHTCYLKEIRHLVARHKVKGLAHITGGGVEGNLYRIIPSGLKAEINWDAWNEPRVFGFLREYGKTPEEDMRKSFNLGIGLIAVLDRANADAVLSEFPSDLPHPVEIGIVVD